MNEKYEIFFYRDSFISFTGVYKNGEFSLYALKKVTYAEKNAFLRPSHFYDSRTLPPLLHMHITTFFACRNFLSKLQN